MADVESIVSEIVDGLVDNCKVNHVALEGWDVDLAIELNYTDQIEVSYTDDTTVRKHKHGVANAAEMTVIRERIAKFLAANEGWHIDDYGQPSAPLIDA
jgi:hypothetical protein